MKQAIRLLILIALFCPVRAFGFPGEVFSVTLSGKEYCGNSQSQGFSQEWFVQLWSDTEVIVSFTSNFQPGTFFSLFGRYYQTGSSSAAFVGGGLPFGDLSAYATIQGTAKLDKTTGTVKSLSGTFIQDAVWEAGCFSSGKFKSTARLQ